MSLKVLLLIMTRHPCEGITSLFLNFSIVPVSCFFFCRFSLDCTLPGFIFGYVDCVQHQLTQVFDVESDWTAQ